MPRHKNTVWNLPDSPNLEYCTLGVLMDIRDELQALNSKLDCYRVRRMLDSVQRIDKRMAKKLPLKGGRT